jgi:hypothetical protein
MNARLERLHRNRTRRERKTQLRRARKLADITGQSQIVVRDRQNDRFRILPYAIRKGEPGGIVITPNKRTR